ncbi:MAG TPA: beta-L-arabinofuranosidase domain-containing protein, partial [Terriglobales bacterium]|nr:beta-L-arabinofuranosidase domain-containing protein [Terriglobales bacterium]
MKPSRRQFLGSVAAAGAAAAAVPAACAAALVSPPPPAPAPLPERIEYLAEPFPPGQVRLIEGPFLAAARVNDDYLQSLTAERLVHMFRLTAGLPSSAEPLGGWEAPQTELRGHFTGHYLSSCGLRYAMLGADGARQRGDAIIAG